MHKIIKAGILLLVLVVPAFVFIFLKVFGENRFTLPTYYPVTDPKTGEVQLRQSNKPGASRYDTMYYTVPIVKGYGENGELINTSFLEGKISIISFFGPVCDSACRQTALQLSRIPDIFRETPDILMLSFAASRPAFITQLRQDNNIPVQRWQVLQVKSEELTGIAMNAFKLKEQPSVSDETFHLTDRLVLVDKAGHIRGYYASGNKDEIERLILEIRVLLDIYAKQ